MSKQKLQLTKLPDIDYEPGKMPPCWSSAMKGLGVCLAILIYIYFIMFLKTEYIRGQKLDHLSEMAEETDALIKKVHKMDEALGERLKNLENLYPV